MKAWLKGGFVGLIIVLIVGLNFLFMDWITQEFGNTTIINPILYISLLISVTLGLPIMITSFIICFKSCIGSQELFIYFIWFVIYILMGMLIGWMNGKVRDKKK
jgi:uncharacterized membrane protein